MTVFKERMTELLTNLRKEAREEENIVVAATAIKLYNLVKATVNGVKTRKEMRQNIAKTILFLNNYRAPQAKEVVSELNDIYTLV